MRCLPRVLVRASEAVRRLYDTVRRGQIIGFKKIRANVRTAAVHEAVQNFFEQEGYKTGRRKGRMEGFYTFPLDKPFEINTGAAELLVERGNEAPEVKRRD